MTHICTANVICCVKISHTTNGINNIYKFTKGRSCLNIELVTFSLSGSGNLIQHTKTHSDEKTFHWHVYVNSYWGETISMQPMWLSFFGEYSSFRAFHNTLWGETILMQTTFQGILNKLWFLRYLKYILDKNIIMKSMWIDFVKE